MTSPNPALDAAMDAVVNQLADEVADMIANWFGRSVIDADRDLALAIMAHLVRDADSPKPTYRDPTYGWRPDDRA